MATNPGTGRLAALATSPAAPAPGYLLLYFKTDGVLYIKDSANVETPIGTASGITSLTGEATASGPGAASVTLSNSAVIGKLVTGFVAGPNSTVLATDTILQALQKLQGQISGFSSTLAGDVTGPFGATVVSFVGGETAADVAISVNDTQAATAANTASTIVKRDASGNFSANIITASLTGTASGNEPPITATTAADYYRGDKTFQPLNKAAVGLSNVDNTSDVNKPVSTAQALADTAVQNFSIQRANHTGTQLASTVSNFDEAAQDAVGNILADTTSVNFTYDDTLNVISADVLPAGVDHNSLQNYVANQHVDHSTVSISAGAGLSGGGDITANRTISMPNVGTPGTYGSATQVPVFTTDAQGRVTAVTDTNISISGSAITDFDERAQDAVGTILTDSSQIDFTYNDGVPSITASIIASSITDTELSTGINANKLADGSISNTELQYINTLTSNAQDQLDAITGANTVDVTIADTDSVDLSLTGQLISADLKLSSDAATAGSIKVTNTVHTGAGAGLHSELVYDTPSNIGTSNFAGSGVKVAAFDHVHAHGNQTSGTLHAAATTSVNGFMSAADKTKLDTSTNLNTASAIVQRDGSGNFSAGIITASLTGNVTGDVTGNVSGSAASFTGNLVGDVSGTQGATVVDFVGGKSEAQIGTSVEATEDATNLASPGTIAKRDVNGDLAVRDLTARKTLPSVVALTDGATINTDAALGNVFTVTIAGNRTFAAPTNPIADQKITYKIRQDATGGRVITWNAAFNFGVDLSGVPNSTSANIFDYYGFQYNATTSRWDCLAISRGY